MAFIVEERFEPESALPTAAALRLNSCGSRARSKRGSATREKAH
jgi:hypothetical protein